MIRRELEESKLPTCKPRPRPTTKVQGRARQSSERKCRVCGADPAPNFYFCPGCHRAVCLYVDADAMIY